jgi:uncharacterized protein YebE (UPF0316 family)
MVVTDSLIAEESATIDSVLVIGSSSTPLDIHVAADKTLTTSCIETFFTGTHEHHNYAHGSFVKTGGGTLRITQATHGSITAVTLQKGLVELGDGVSLVIGGNEIIGGTLENVQMLVTGDITRTLYSGVAIFVSGQVVDAVVYRFDYSKVALIISKEHGAIAAAIAKELGRGATFLHGEGTYSQIPTKVVLTAVKRQQMTELKRLVVAVDPNAFIIIQDAHQVLGDGFSRYCKNSL